MRDLYGTLQNEGASKGILVTTSGYGKASYDFAEGKPIELFDGTNLLYLLETHTGIKARIEPPDDWQDPVPDSGEYDERFALPAKPTAAQPNEAAAVSDLSDAAVAEAARARADVLRRQAEELQDRKPSGE